VPRMDVLEEFAYGELVGRIGPVRLGRYTF
jgi:hypothetical protein